MKKLRYSPAGLDEIIGNKTGDESIHEDSFGLTRRGRSAVAYLAVAATAAAILCGAFALAVHIPHDSELTAEQAGELLSEDSEYKELLEQTKTLEDEKETLAAQREALQSTAKELSDYDNTMAALDRRISDKRKMLETIRGTYESKKAELENINSQIRAKNGSETVLTPGDYTVGAQLLPGRYSVTGSGKFKAATSDGLSKANELLGSAAYEITLDSGDRISISATTKFTPID